jgi:hypothetical protein
MVNPSLEPGVGYGIVLGLGFAFALGMVSCTHIPPLCMIECHRRKVVSIGMGNSCEQLLTPTIDPRHVCPQTIQFGARNVGNVQHGRKNSQEWFGRIRSRQFMDVGRHSVAINRCVLQIWSFWSLLVCVWCYRSDPLVCDAGYRAEETRPKRSHLP